MVKPLNLHNSNAGNTVHWFLYGYPPTITGITRESIRIAAKHLGKMHFDYIYDKQMPENIKSMIRVRLPLKFSRGPDGQTIHD